eukprot:4861987-Pyramimonas_sp.AAC.1
MHYVAQTVATANARMGRRLWVDDLSQAVKGSRRAVRQLMIKFLLDTCRDLGKYKLRVAAKSTVMCTTHQDARAIEKAVRKAGYNDQPVRQAALLGVDFGCGRHARAT